jgi:hypothetical protein
MKIKHYILTFLFLAPVFYIFPQASVTISEYGVYFINEGKVIKLPIEHQVSFPIFWRNYIIFLSGEIVYNIENGTISNWLSSGADGGRFLVESNNDNIIFYVGGNEYELDPVTLEILKSRKTSRNYNERPNDYDSRGDYPNLIYIDKKYLRFQGKNFYLDVILTDNIDDLKIQEVHGGKVNKFLLIIDYRYDGGR